MIPIRLKIRGLYSYQSAQTIEFKHLIAGQIFGIFGAVGSGKSSILDAITFALYGETERLNQRDNRKYNMMNLRSNEMEVDFEFKNFDQKVYRFRVQAKRHGSKFDDVYPPKRSAYVWQNDQWTRLEETTAESIIGISYQNFKRTIIIPQGKFQEFLQLGSTDRTNMLKEIFHLEKYELYAKVAHISHINDDKILVLKTKLLQYEHISANSIKEKSDIIISLEKQVQQKKEELKEVTEKCRQNEQLKSLAEELLVKQQELEKIDKHSASIQEQKKQVSQYEYALEHFKKLIDSKKEFSLEHQKNEDELIAIKESIKAFNSQIELIEQQLSQLMPFIRDKDKYQEQAKDLLQWDEIVIARQKLKFNRSRIEKGKLEVERAISQKQKLDKEIGTINEKISKLKAHHLDRETMSALQQWFHLDQMQAQQIKALDDEILSLEKQKGNARQALQNLLIDQGELSDEFESRKRSKTNLVKLLHAWRRELQEEKDKETSHLQHLKMQSKLSDWTNQLENGAPCPLCGSVHHPKILDVENVEVALLKSQQKIEKTHKEIILLDRKLQESIALQKELESYSNQIKISSKQREKKVIDKKSHRDTYSWEHLLAPDIKLWPTFHKNVIQNQKDIDSAENRLLRIQTEIKQYDVNLLKYQKALREIENIQIALTTQIQTLKNTLDQFKDEAQLDMSRPMVVQSEEINQLVLDRDKKFDYLNLQLQDMKQKLAASQADKRKVKANTSTLLKKIKKNGEAIQLQIKSSPFSKIEQIYSTLDHKFDISKTRQIIGQFENQYAILNSEVDQIKAVLKRTPYNAQTHNSLSSQSDKISTLLEVEQKSLIERRAEIEKEQKDLIQKTSINKDLQALETRKIDIQLMKKLFKGSGFVNYISSVFLKNLCLAANARFYSLTRQQFKLEVTENNDFVVRDFLNDGRLRSVKTLSGGQTFQASLSLALALAESVQHENKANQNFFFLDEGFGALDKRALQTVFDTLKSLRKENRVVGVISHVEDMQQEIDVFIQVSNDPDKGSTLNSSWESPSHFA